MPVPARDPRFARTGDLPLVRPELPWSPAPGDPVADDWPFVESDTDAAVATVEALPVHGCWPPPVDPPPPPEDPPEPPPLEPLPPELPPLELPPCPFSELFGVLDSVGAVSGALGIELVTSGVDTVTFGVDTPTSGVFTATPGSVTSTLGTSFSCLTGMVSEATSPRHFFRRVELVTNSGEGPSFIFGLPG